MGSSLKEKNLLLRSKFFTLRVDPIKQEEKMKMKACFPHESVPIYLKSYPLRYDNKIFLGEVYSLTWDVYFVMLNAGPWFHNIPQLHSILFLISFSYFSVYKVLEFCFRKKTNDLHF